MKNRLLTLAALSWAASAMAGDWELPTMDWKGMEPTDQTAVYILNTETGQFLTGANAWGTQTSITGGDQMTPVQFVLVQEETSAGELAWGMKNQRADKKDKYVFFDGGGNAFIDMGTQNQANPDCNYWNFVQQEDGTYTIQVVESCPLYTEGSYFAWDGSTEGSTVVMPGLNPEEIAEIDGAKYGMYWKFIGLDEYAVYGAKLALYAKLNEAEESGIDTSAAEAVYNNPAATVEEIDAAVAALAKAIKNALLGEEFYNATVEEPYDATEIFITNPDFEGGNADGWEWGADDVSNQGFQGAGYTNGDVQIGKFVEIWKNGGPLGNGYIRQQIEGLPAGLYRLEADVNVTRQYQAPANEVTGAYLMAGEARTPMATNDGKPEHYTVTFYAEDGASLTIGVILESTNANWLAADNFKLFYMGNVSNVAYVELQAAVLQLEAVAGEEPTNDKGNYTYSAETYEAYEALINKVGELSLESSEEELQAAEEEVNALMNTIKAEKAAYVKLEKLYDEVASATEKFANLGDVLMGPLNDLFDAVTAALEDGTYSIDEINAAVAEYDRILKEELPAAMVPGTDVTGLLVNPNFDGNSNAGWEGGLVVDHGCAEKYNTTFNVYQDLTGLKPGLYEVRLNGYVRQGFAGDAYSRYLAGDEVRAFIYGESGGVRVKKPFRNVFEAMDTERHYSDGSWMTDSEITGEDGELYYIPNSMAGFEAWQEARPEAFTTTAQLFVLDGTLRIGAISEQYGPDNGGYDGDWCIFDTFGLTYVSDQIGDALKGAIQEDIDALIVRRDNILDSQSLPVDICTAIDALSGELSAASSEEEVKAVAAKVEETSRQLTTVAAEVLAQLDAYYYYQEMLDEVTSPDPEGFSAFLDEAYQNYEPGSATWETTEAMRDELAQMQAGWAKYVCATVDMEGASEKNPADVSEIIANRGFNYAGSSNDGSTRFGWNNPGATNFDGANWSEMEVYNTPKFDVNQNIAGLTEGYYLLKCQGFYRMGWPDAVAKNDSTVTSFVSLYAKTEEQTWSTPLQGIMAGASTEAFSGDLASGEITVKKYDSELGDSVEVYIPNLMPCAQYYFNPFDEAGEPIEGASRYNDNAVVFHVAADGKATIGVAKPDTTVNGDWTCFDNFQLYYLGKTAPDAVKGIAGNGAAVSQKYFTIGGLQVARPQKGVNIVVTELSDGTKVTTKVIVR